MQISRSPSNLAQLLKNIPLKYPSMKRLIFSPKLLLLATLLSLLSSGLYAQNPDIVNGYMITAKGDSLVGQIHVGSIKQNYLKFRASADLDWVVLYPKDLKLATGENGLLILPQKIHLAEVTESILVEQIVNGTYGLYKGNISQGSTFFFIELNRSNSLIRLNPFGYVAQFKALLGTCAQSMKTNNLQYNSTRLSQYLTAINQCVNPNETPVKIRHTRFKPSFGIGVIGYYYTIQPRLSGENRYYLAGDYATINRLGAGFTTKLKLTPGLGFFAGCQYVDKRMTADSMTRKIKYLRAEPGIPPYVSQNVYRYSLDLDFKYLEIPVGFNYSFLPYSKWSPNITFGFAITIPITSEIYGDWGYPIDPYSVPPGEVGHLFPKDASYIQSYSESFFGGIGIIHSFKNKNELEIKAEYYNQTEQSSISVDKVSESLKFFTNTSRFQFSVLYTFYFKSKS